ncbi:hypothetical protein [Cellulomonas sp. PhB150]|uniref:hypothetical protein n=1 Tax=Cellulomonas sp. PhB150 TaxID=2485188 RepID=UPI000F49EE9E|nr:hypothetical protein [Cellulomonas sp. PhB150]ROS31467.1 hypothetical protein EDF34_1126 [Cellulomonas sp. PhB150]
MSDQEGSDETEVRKGWARGPVVAAALLVAGIGLIALGLLGQDALAYVAGAVATAAGVAMLPAALLARRAEGRAPRWWPALGAALVVVAVLVTVPAAAVRSAGDGVVWSVEQESGALEPEDVAAVGDAYLLVSRYRVDVIDAATGQRRGGLAVWPEVRGVTPVGSDGVLVASDGSVAFYRVRPASAGWDLSSTQPEWRATSACEKDGVVEPAAADGDLVLLIDASSCGGTVTARAADGSITWTRSGFARGLPALTGEHEGRYRHRIVEPLPTVGYALSRDGDEVVTVDVRTGDELARTPRDAGLRSASADLALWSAVSDEGSGCETSATRRGQVLWTREMPCLGETAWTGERYWGSDDPVDTSVAPTMLDVETGETTTLPGVDQYASTGDVLLSRSDSIRAAVPPSTATAWTWSGRGAGTLDKEVGPGTVALRSSPVGLNPFVGSDATQVTVLDATDGSVLGWYRHEDLRVVGSPQEGGVLVVDRDRLTLLGAVDD